MANISSINGNPIVVGSSGISDGATTEAKLASALANALVKGRGYAPDNGALTDANHVERNSVMIVKSDSGVTNLPTDERCMLITLGNGTVTTDTAPAVQLCAIVSSDITTSPVTKIWARSRWGASISQWTDWYECIMSSDGLVHITASDIPNASISNEKLATGLFNSLLMGQGYINDPETTYDANELARNTVYFLSTVGTCLNVPEGETGGFIITIGNGTSTLNTSVAAQIFLSAYGENSPWTGKMYYRTRYGASTNIWSEWSEVFDRASSLTDDFSDLSMFTRIGVLGDSYASGAIHFSNESIPSIVNYDQSWPMNIHRQCGCEISRYSYPGWGTYSFVTPSAPHYNDFGLDKLTSDAVTNPCGLYICCFGINDSNPNFSWGGVSGGADYLGTIEDIDDDNSSNNANSFYGNYGRIISAIKSAAPNALIVLGTAYHRYGTRYEGYNAAVQEIAEHFGIEWIDFRSDPFMTSDYYNACYQGSHPTAQMYAGIAKAVNRLIVGRMRANPSYFNDYPGC